MCFSELRALARAAFLLKTPCVPHDRGVGERGKLWMTLVGGLLLAQPRGRRLGAGVGSAPALLVRSCIRRRGRARMDAPT